MGSLQLGARHEYRVAATWKVMIDNYHECYHCPLIHPELCKVSPPTSGDNWSLPGAWVGGSMDLRPHASTMSFDGTGPGVYIPDAPRRTQRGRAVRAAGMRQRVPSSRSPPHNGLTTSRQALYKSPRTTGEGVAELIVPGWPRTGRPAGRGGVTRDQGFSAEHPGVPAARSLARWGGWVGL